MSERPGSIRGDRRRKNVLKDAEYGLIEAILPRLPGWVTPDLLTAFGLAGSLVIYAGLWLGREAGRGWLALSIFGLFIHWFGDSLDGRLAYYRKRPRKWYGWALDINVDWLSACIMGLGFFHYLPDLRIVSFVFVVAYGGSMIVALLRYKISDRYEIDTFGLGPTELRILLAGVILVEIWRPDTLLQFGLVGSLLLVFFNAVESWRVLKLGDARDAAERESRSG